jgi:threonine dehydratase
MTEEPNFGGIKEAYSLIKKYIHTTPLLTCETLNEIASENSNQRNLFFKCENFQKVGAFKFRGTMNVFKISRSCKCCIFTF